ncbi:MULTISPECIES: hypothetical protein [Salinibaculum]|uniref:hypothetical protein n=1 Tax=Salinibaculum TaxID=2732368 RepID=UPI0030D1B169
MKVADDAIQKGLRHPIKALKHLFDSIYRDGVLTASSRSLLGTNIYTCDWDLLIILDTCRLDALKLVASEYDFLTPNKIETATSVGGSTLEWTANTFTHHFRDEIVSTGFVSANGWPRRILREGYNPEQQLDMSVLPKFWSTVSESDLGVHIPAWKYGPGRGAESDQPQASAETVVDFVIRLGREQEFDRVIAHLIEPHYPYVGALEQRGDIPVSKFGVLPWRHVESKKDIDLLWDLYIQELRIGLDSIERLLNNFDAERVLITADHGEAFGELGVFGHNTGSLHPKVRQVPVTWTTADDHGSYHPPKYEEDQNMTVEQNLEALGYLPNRK